MQPQLVSMHATSAADSQLARETEAKPVSVLELLLHQRGWRQRGWGVGAAAASVASVPAWSAPQ